MKDIVITSASRTAIGSLSKFKNTSAEELGSVVIWSFKKSNLKNNDLDEVIMDKY